MEKDVKRYTIEDLENLVREFDNTQERFNFSEEFKSRDRIGTERFIKWLKGRKSNE